MAAGKESPIGRSVEEPAADLPPRLRPVLRLEALELFLEPLPLVGASTIATLPPENAVELGGW
jgi:hypothetical protein